MTRRYVSCAETAKLVRAALKAKFPGVKFSVRSHTYSGGASIDVTWLDGPTGKDVALVTELYRGSTFDGMIDLRTSHTTLLASPDGSVEEVHFAADYVFTHRNLSPEFQATLGAMYEAEYGAVYDREAYDNSADHYYRKLVSETWGPLRKVAKMEGATR
jgi:hypothetical protein